MISYGRPEKERKKRKQEAEGGPPQGANTPASILHPMGMSNPTKELQRKQNPHDAASEISFCANVIPNKTTAARTMTTSPKGMWGG